MEPIRLPANQPADRFYRGGPGIRAFRGEASAGDRVPEDWVASTTTLAGERVLGLSMLPDGRRLVDAIGADPEGWLGAEHVSRFGPDIRLLVKLLDAGQRLPVHAHPDGAFAAEHLARAHGKTEAWYVLEGGDVHLGLIRDVDHAELSRLVETQDSPALLTLLHRERVEPGDVVAVPAGELHAIGAGLLIVELQEPEDLSILAEWRGFEIDGRRDGHLGLGFDVALGAVSTSARPPLRGDLVVRAGYGQSVLPAVMDDFFRLERRRITGASRLEPGFAVLVVTSGTVEIDSDSALVLESGATVVVPHAHGPMRLNGDGEVIVCRPPTGRDR